MIVTRPSTSESDIAEQYRQALHLRRARRAQRCRQSTIVVVMGLALTAAILFVAFK